MRWGIVHAILAALVCRTAGAQSQASLGFGVGTVRFAGGSRFSAASVSPAAQFLSPSLYVGAGASFSSLPDGAWAAQGRADLWAATPARAQQAARLAIGGSWAGSTRSDGVWTAAAHGIGEALWSETAWGVAIGAGPSAGWIERAPSVTALHLRARAWWQAPGGGVQYSLSVEPTRFQGTWFTDVYAAATVERGRVVASAWASARLSRAYDSEAAASASVQLFVTPTVALEASGGAYLSDPYQGFPRVGYFSAGVRLHAAPRAPPPPPRAATTPRWPPLVPERRGDSLVVRFRMEGTSTVAIAGNWNAWRPVPLRPLGDGLWEGSLALPAGTYHFNLLVDGKEWVVPAGVAIISDGMGGLVAILTVPP